VASVVAYIDGFNLYFGLKRKAAVLQPMQHWARRDFRVIGVRLR